MKKIGKIFSAIVTVALSAAVAISIVGCGSGSKKSSSTASSKTGSSATRATSSPSLTSSSTADSVTTRPTAVPTTAASRPTASTEATIPQDTKIIERAALLHFGLTPGPNTAVDILSVEKTPDKKVYYLANVYYDGYTYPVYVSADGSGTYEPEVFYEMYGMTEQLYQSDGDSGDGSYYGGDSYDADPYDYYYDYGYDYGYDYY